MTNEEKRIAIAEICGWQIIGRPDQYDPPKGFPSGVLMTAKNVQDVPDYLNDLNAMHDAENEVFKRNMQGTWLAAMVEIASGETGIHWSDYADCPEMAHTTAAQRGDAFLMTFGILKP